MQKRFSFLVFCCLWMLCSRSEVSFHHETFLFLIPPSQAASPLFKSIFPGIQQDRINIQLHSRTCRCSVVVLKLFLCSHLRFLSNIQLTLYKKIQTLPLVTRQHNKVITSIIQFSRSSRQVETVNAGIFHSQSVRVLENMKLNSTLKL